MPRPWEIKEPIDLATTNWTYIQWLGDRKGIEEKTKTWDKIIIDRKNDLEDWVEVLKKMVNTKKILKMFAFANNHYALCRCRHKAYYAASRIMPIPPHVVNTVSPAFLSSAHTGA